MSNQIEAAVLNLVRAVTAEYETLLTSHVRAAVQSAMHKAAPTTSTTGQVSQIYRHYKTGGYYRKLFHTTSGVAAPGNSSWTELFLATISTNEPTTNGARVMVYIAGNNLYAAVPYDAVVYVSLTDGEIYIREKKEFEGLVGVSSWPCGWMMVLRFMPVDFVPVANAKSWDPSAEDRK